VAVNRKEFTKTIGETGEDRIRFKFVVDNGKVVDIVVQYECLSEGKWREVVRYDFAHGFFHRDLISPKGEKEKKRIDIDNLKLATIYAEEDLKDRWEWYKQNYLKQLRKK
jgi:hypothetical protein